MKNGLPSILHKMKRLLFILLILPLITSNLAAQCNNAFYQLKEGRAFEMTMYNKKNKPQGRTLYSISDVQESNGALEATFNSAVYDKKDKLIADGNYVVVCEGNKVKIDMKSMTTSMAQLSAYENMEIEAEGSFIEIPASLKVGQQLPDANTQMRMKMGEGDVTMSEIAIHVINRTVNTKESISTPAGTFECYKISYDTDIDTKVMGISRKTTFSSAEWIAEGVGVVKTETYDKKGELNSYSVLTSIQQ